MSTKNAKKNLLLLVQRMRAKLIEILCKGWRLQRFGQNSLLTFSALIFSIYLAEITLGLLPMSVTPLDERAASAKALGLAFDTRTKYEVVSGLRDAGKDAYPAMHLNHYTALSIDATLFPLSGAARKLTVLGNESGTYIIYTSDEYGFNNPLGKYRRGVYEIALVGDSFVQGAYVPTAKNISSLLNVQGHPTANLGIIGAGPLIQLGIIKEYLPLLRPKHVFWFYCEDNDLLDLRTENSFNVLRQYLKPSFSQGLIDRQVEIQVFLERYLERQLARVEEMLTKKREDHKLLPIETQSERTLRATLSLVKLRKLRRQAIHYIRELSEPKSLDFDLDLYSRSLTMASKVVSSWGGQLYFVYLPSWQRYATTGQPKPAHLRQRSRIMEIVTERGIPCIDVHLRFKEHPDPTVFFPFGLNGHYNELGYKLVSEVLSIFPPIDGNSLVEMSQFPYYCDVP